MESQTIVEALLLGLLEGLTEFIPVSSTGHILLAGHFLGFESTGKAFEVLIQLGAILAVIGVFLRRLWTIFVKLPTSRRSKRFVLGVLIAFALMLALDWLLMPPPTLAVKPLPPVTRIASVSRPAVLPLTVTTDRLTMP